MDITDNRTGSGGLLFFLIGIVLVYGLYKVTSDSQFIAQANDWLAETRESVHLPSGREAWSGIHEGGRQAIAGLIDSFKTVK